jgi:hypothetical protein
MGNGEGPGIVYILKNRLLVGWTKIGSTMDLPHLVQRVKELSEGVPVPWEVHRAVEVVKRYAAEKSLQNFLKKLKVPCNREFFQIDPDIPADFMSIWGLKDVTPSLETTVGEEGIEALKKFEEEEIEREKRKAFKFSMIEFDPNSKTTIYFGRGHQYTGTVFSDDKIELEGSVVSLSEGTNKLLVKYFKRRDGTPYPLDTNTADGSGAWELKMPDGSFQRLNLIRSRIEEEQRIKRLEEDQSKGEDLEKGDDE